MEFIEENKNSIDAEKKILALLAEKKFFEAANISAKDAEKIEEEYDDLIQKKNDTLFEKLRETGNYYYNGAHFYEALEFYNKAMTKTNRDINPQRNALINFHLGNTLINIAQLAKDSPAIEHLSEAKRAYNEALMFYNEKLGSDMWYMLNNNIGNIYREESKFAIEVKDKHQLLDLAIQAYKKLDTESLKKSNFELWLLAKNNEGVVLLDKSRLSMDNKSQGFLDEAIRLYRALKAECNDNCNYYEPFKKIEKNLSIALMNKAEFVKEIEKDKLLKESYDLSSKNHMTNNMETWARNKLTQAENIWNQSLSMMGQGKLEHLKKSMEICNDILRKLMKINILKCGLMLTINWAGVSWIYLQVKATRIN